MVEVGIEAVKSRLDHYERLGHAGIEVEGASFGPLVFVWTRTRDGKEKWEAMPSLLAEWRVAAIPFEEPEIERAKIVSSYHSRIR